jgi:NADP-dependent 3-hydroxy acid dehydrogenase YdfG
MSQRFSEQVAVVTGRASGIGEAITKRIMSEGGNVVMFAMHQENLERVARDFGAGAKIVDVSDEGQVEAEISYVLETSAHTLTPICHTGLFCS